jgi:hypothetical protein
MSQFIYLTEAEQMTAKYREARQDLLGSEVSLNTLPICETFERSHIENIFSNEDVVGLRAYFALNSDDQVTLVLVGVNDNDEDIIVGDYAILDRAARCPTICPPSSPLNS